VHIKKDHIIQMVNASMTICISAALKNMLTKNKFLVEYNYIIIIKVQMIPLYFRVESFLKNRILSGQLEPASKLPTEDELIHHFGVSRITIRNALSHLEKEGLIVRHRSKGSFVSEKIPMKKQFIFTSEVRDLISDAKKYQTKPLSIHTEKVGNTKVPKVINEFFTLTNEDEICSIKRIRQSNNIPIYYIENFMASDVARHLTLKDLAEKPLLEILKKRIGLTIGRGEMYIEAIPADSDIASIIQCETFDPLFFVQIFYWFPNGDPFEVVNRYVRADYFKYRVELDPKGFESV